VGPRAGLERCEKPRPHRDSISRTIQPVAGRYTDYATRPTICEVGTEFSNSKQILHKQAQMSNCALLGYYAARIVNFVQTFGDR
jgi:hypothetical protein